MSIGGAGGGDGGDAAVCAACGRPGTKKCSRCKSVRYCSQECQSKHWGAEHKLGCKQVRSSDKVDSVPSGDDGAYRRRKSSGLGSISLVPARGSCKVLQEPKKILFPYDEFVKLFNWDKPGFPPCGLLNCGNSCFANVVLQCLACTRPLTAYLLEKGHSRTCIRKQEDWCFLCELQAHIQRACQSRQPFSPINILSRIPNIGGNLGYGRQEDAHEFMRFVIDTMQSVCLDEHGGEKALDHSTLETTLIQHIFGGHLQSQVKCTKCNMISNRYENMMDLTVEIHGDAESLEECLDQFTVKEWLDGDNMYKCDGCNGYVNAWKRLTVHQAPNILTIALKRFQSGRFGKLNKRVTFPEQLDLSPYMSDNGDGTDLYSLYAVVVHIDMLNASFFGHYICYTQDYFGRWYRIDDCKVTNADVEEVLSQGAYLLLYRRRTARREPFVKSIEPARKKHFAAKGVDLLNVHNGEIASSDLASISSCTGSESKSDLASISSNTCSESNLSLLRDTGHDRDIKTDTVKGKEDLVFEVPDEAKLMLVGKDFGDVDMNDSKFSSMEPKGCEVEGLSQPSHIQEDVVAVHTDTNPLSRETPSSAEVQDMDCEEAKGCEDKNSNQYSHIQESAAAISKTNTTLFSPATISSAEVQDMECEQPFGICDASYHIKESGLVCAAGEMPHFSGCTSDSSFCSKNMASGIVHKMVMSSPNASVSSLSTAASELNPEPIMVEHCPLGPTNGVDKVASSSCSSEGTNVLPPVLEKGSVGKPKLLFSRGFLDRLTGEKSTDHEKRTKAEKPKVASYTIANGYSNGHPGLNGDANAAPLKLPSDRGRSTPSDSDMAYINRGFLNRPYRKPAAKLKNGQANCRDPDEVAPASEAEAACSSENCSTSASVICNRENGCSVSREDATSIVEGDKNSNDISDCESKLTNGMCCQNGHTRFGDLKGLAINAVERGCGNCK